MRWAHLIGADCIDVLDRSCVKECPVEFLYEGGRKVYINLARSASTPRSSPPMRRRRSRVASKGRELVKMTDAEVGEFLAVSKKVQVATVNADGSPHLTTLFYVVQDGRIAFWTYGRSQKIRNLEREPRIACLVESGDDYFELRGVSITGRAELVTDEEGIRRIGSAVASRMVDGADLGGIGRDEVERQVRKRVGVVVVPEKTASWDHRKMLAGAQT